MPKTTEVKASQHDSYGTYSLISFLLPTIGIIVGIVFLTKDKKLDKKLGEHCVVIGILSLIFLGFVLGVWVTINPSSGVITPLTPAGTTIPASDILSDQPSADVIKITNTSVKNDGYSIYEVVGEATNNDTAARTFTLKATFYSSSGGILGTATGAVDSLGAGQTKTFNLVSTDNLSGYTKYKVQVDTIF